MLTLGDTRCGEKNKLGCAVGTFSQIPFSNSRRFSVNKNTAEWIVYYIYQLASVSKNLKIIIIKANEIFICVFF